MRSIVFLAVTILPFVAFADQASDNFYKSIRSGDQSALRELIKSSGADTPDARGTTPLMMAAAYGNLDSMTLLLDAGAKVNAANEFGATALLWSAADQAKVQLLLANGADVNTKSKLGRSPLLIAAGINGNSNAVRMLLEKGANPTVADNNGTTPLLLAATAGDTASIRLLLAAKAPADQADKGGTTPLLNAATNGNIEAVKALLAHQPNVNAVSVSTTPSKVKNGTIALDRFTPLIAASAYGSPDLIKLLLDAGANVNAQDVRGMTPLIYAIASDRPDVRVVRALIARGADVSVRTKDGETALDWAKKYNHPEILSALGSKRASVAPVKIAASSSQTMVRPAVDRGMEIMQKTASNFFATGGCAACHAQNINGLLLSTARAAGLKLNEQAVMGGLKGTEGFWRSFEQPLLQTVNPPGAVDTVGYTVLDFAAGQLPASSTTDALVTYLAAHQYQSGNWHDGTIARPPIEDGDISRTALALRALQNFGIPARKAEFDERIARAANWIKQATARNQEDLNMQLLSLVWTGADRAVIAGLAKRIQSKQRADGGWGQTDFLSSDAYATGQTLYALQQAKVSVEGRPYKRGVAFLLATQKSDGSWQVASRALKFQPYFQSGFPHDHDQWISMAGTAWAMMGLARALPANLAAR